MQIHYTIYTMSEAIEYEEEKKENKFFFSKHIFALTLMSNSTRCNASYSSQSTDAILTTHNVMGGRMTRF